MDIGERSSTDSLLGTCPLPLSRYEHILLGHGSGGKLTSDLIQRLFVPGFGDDTLAALEDQATVNLGVQGDNGRQAPRPCSFLPLSFSRRGSRWPTSRELLSRCGGHATRPAWPWSPATPRWSTAARATACTSRPRALAWCRRAARCRSTTPGRVTGSLCRGHSATTASPSCRCARAWNSRPCSKATQHR